MSEPYLILHRVRGAPAFDIATKIDCPRYIPTQNLRTIDECEVCNGGGFWWIIPTSGHRAYPYWTAQLDPILAETSSEDLNYPRCLPADWPDHYPKPTPEPFKPSLILHKVHGQPAFDIATKIQIGEEEGWIIPTSGHRAYPYRWWTLDYLHWQSRAEIQEWDDIVQPMTEVQNGIPADWPDHYPKPTPEPFKPSLIQRLGLVRQPPRRI